MGIDDIFTIPVSGNYLIYAPLHQLAAFVDRRGRQQIQHGLQKLAEPTNPTIKSIICSLVDQSPTLPQVRSGALKTPLFLGIIPTRDCNMGCRYCDFVASKSKSQIMSLSLARTAVDAYIRLLIKAGATRADIHFFGGEPFFAPELVHFVVNYATQHASANGMGVHFEATSNGLYSVHLCQWIADHFQTLVLSLDGPADIQNKHRPGIHGQPLFDVVARNAAILSEGSVELIIRACITDESLPRLPEIAAMIARDFRPSTVCLESLTPTPGALAAGFHPPDPWEFARQFYTASQILEAVGIKTILSTADTSATRLTFCPVGQDALIVSPDGALNACYLLERDWQRQGLDLRLGRLAPGQAQLNLNADSVARMRQLNVEQKPLCAHCFCRFHCAGGCHVNHNTALPYGRYDNLCLQTRLITITKLLCQLNQHEYAQAWLNDDQSLRQSAWQQNDRLLAQVDMV